jgi:aminoglycoside 2''-phosphotransferase
MADDDDFTGYLRELVACRPDFAVREARPAQQGWDSLTLLVNGDTIVRFARRPDVAARLAREAALLPRLADALPVAVPRFTLTCPDPAGGLRFVGYPAIPGAPLSAGSIPPSTRASLADQFGAFLAALHGFPVAEAIRLGAEGGTAANWRAELARLYGEVRAHVLPRLTDDDERARMESLWERYLGDDANFAFAPALIHRDLGPEHILHDPAAGRLTGVIDWGDASIGDPSQDFTGVYRTLGAAFARRVHDAYAPSTADATFWRRVRFYAAIVPFFEIIFGSLEGDEGHVAAGLAALRQQR